MNDIKTRFARFWILHFSNSERRKIWMKLSKLISNGVPIIQALTTLYERRRRGHGANDQQVIALLYWITGMKNGRRLSEMLDGWVSPIERMMIAAGENSGSLQEALEATIRIMVARREIVGTVIKGVTYPIVLTIMAFFVLYVFGTKIVPQFTKIVPAEQFTGVAATFIFLTDIAKSWILLVAAAAIFLVLIFLFSLPRWDGRVRIFLDRYAPYSVYRVIQGSTWLISLAALLEAGVRLENALQQLASMSDKWLSTRINAALRSMRTGLQLGDALQRVGYEFPDREIIDDLGVYSELSGFDEALSIIGNEWLSESVSKIKEKMAIVFGISVLLVALLIGTTITGMITMQFQLVEIIKTKSR